MQSQKEKKRLKLGTFMMLRKVGLRASSEMKGNRTSFNFSVRDIIPSVGFLVWVSVVEKHPRHSVAWVWFELA